MAVDQTVMEDQDQVQEFRALVPVTSREVPTADLDMYRKHFCPTAPQAEWELFVQKCLAYGGLNPMRGQIFLVKRTSKGRNGEPGKDTYTTQIAITGMVALAEGTKRFEGFTAPEYYDKELNKYEVWPTSKGPYPYAIRVGAYKNGYRDAQYAICYWHERAVYYGNPDSGNLADMWKKQGIHMLWKCTCAAALRWAFEDAVGNLYIAEEMGRADQDAAKIGVISGNTRVTSVVESNQVVESTPPAATRQPATPPAATRNAPAPRPTREQAPVASNQVAPRQQSARQQPVKPVQPVGEIPTPGQLKAEVEALTIPMKNEDGQEYIMTWVEFVGRALKLSGNDEARAVLGRELTPGECAKIAKVVKAFRQMQTKPAPEEGVTPSGK